MHHSYRMPRMHKSSSRQEENGDPFPESDILKEINRAHLQYSANGTDEYHSDPQSRSPSRPVTAGKKKRVSVGPNDVKVPDAPRLSSFSTRPVLQDIDSRALDWNHVDPKTVTTLSPYKIEVVGENTRERKNKEEMTLIISITGRILSIYRVDIKNPNKEFWRCEKMYSDLCLLDMKLRQFHAQYIEKIPGIINCATYLYRQEYIL
jgi:hypothetical protein